jgi:hypothetical protein
MEPTITYVPGYESDIFVSYASADDQKELKEDGQVTTFIQLLSVRLARYLGGSKKFSIWMDRSRITGEFQLSPGIEGPLQKTALMLAFLSRAYHDSEWCPRERGKFLESAPPSADGRTRIFFVELDQLEDGMLPRESLDAHRYRFWQKGHTDKYPRRLDVYNPIMEAEYKDRIDELARDLSATLDHMKQGAAAATSPANLANGSIARLLSPSSPPKATVYLAETTDDLEPLWRKVKGYLEQQNIAVVPPKQDLPRDPDAFLQAIKSHMADAQLFVQLLSLVPGRNVDNQHTYVSRQYAFAQELKLPTLQWRDPRLSESDRAGVEEAVHRDLLDGPDVQAVQIEEFRQNIVQTLERLRKDKERQQALAERQQARACGKTKNQYVFILADPVDGSIAEKIYCYLDEQGFPCGLPVSIEANSREVPPEQIREDFEDNLHQAAGTIIVHGSTQPQWYRNQLTMIRKASGVQCKLGLAIAPPPKKVLYKPPWLYHLVCGDGIDQESFQTFLEALADSSKCETVNA